LVQIMEMHLAKSELFLHNRGTCHTRIIDAPCPDHESSVSKKQKSDLGDGNAAKNGARRVCNLCMLFGLIILQLSSNQL